MIRIVFNELRDTGRWVKADTYLEGGLITKKLSAQEIKIAPLQTNAAGTGQPIAERR